MSKILCTICARGGSKGLPNKNIKNMYDVPLIAYTIDQAKKSKIFDKIVISTDSDKISNISKLWGSDICFKRPKYLSTDKARKLDVIKKTFLKSEKYFNKKYDFCIDLDATAPLRRVNDIIEFANLLKKQKGHNLITVTAVRKNPYFNMIETDKVGWKKIKKSKLVRRQDAPIVFDMNASMYGWDRDSLISRNKIVGPKTLTYEMKDFQAYDIDSKFDWEIVKYLIKKYRFQIPKKNYLKSGSKKYGSL